MPLKLRKKFSNKTTRRNLQEAEDDEKEEGTKAGGDNTDVEVTADGEGAKSADGVTPKIAKPFKPHNGGLGKTEVEDLEIKKRRGRRL